MIGLCQGESPFGLLRSFDICFCITDKGIYIFTKLWYDIFGIK